MSTLSGFHKKRSSFLQTAPQSIRRASVGFVAFVSFYYTSLAPRGALRRKWCAHGLCVPMYLFVARTRVCVRVRVVLDSSRLDVSASPLAPLAPLAHLATFPPASMALSSVPPIPPIPLSVVTLPPLAPPSPLAPVPALSRAASKLFRIAQSALSKCFTSLAINRGFGRTSPYLA